MWERITWWVFKSLLHYFTCNKDLPINLSVSWVWQPHRDLSIKRKPKTNMKNKARKKKLGNSKAIGLTADTWNRTPCGFARCSEVKKKEKKFWFGVFYNSEVLWNSYKPWAFGLSLINLTMGSFSIPATVDCSMLKQG